MNVHCVTSPKTLPCPSITIIDSKFDLVRCLDFFFLIDKWSKKSEKNRKICKWIPKFGEKIENSHLKEEIVHLTGNLWIYIAWHRRNLPCPSITIIDRKFRLVLMLEFLFNWQMKWKGTQNSELAVDENDKTEYICCWCRKSGCSGKKSHLKKEIVHRTGNL